MQNTFPRINPVALSRRLKGDPKVTLMDVRSPAEYRSGHIPGAPLLPLDTLDGASLTRLADDSGLRADNPLYLTCQAGVRATQAEA